MVIGRGLIDRLAVLAPDLQALELRDVFGHRSSSAHLPSSHSIIIAAPVIGLVIEAMRKMLSVRDRRRLGRDVEHAIGVEVHDLAVAGDQRHDIGQLALVDQGVELAVESGQAFGG